MEGGWDGNLLGQSHEIEERTVHGEEKEGGETTTDRQDIEQNRDWPKASGQSHTSKTESQRSGDE